MEQLLRDTQLALEKGITGNYHDFLRLHDRIFGYGHSGCKCKAQKLYGIIYTWYQDNKPKVVDDNTGLPKK